VIAMRSLSATDEMTPTDRSAHSSLPGFECPDLRCGMDVTVRPAQENDRDAVLRALTAAWGGTVVVGHGVRYDAATLPALIAERDGELVGVLTLRGRGRRPGGRHDRLDGAAVGCGHSAARGRGPDRSRGGGRTAVAGHD